MDSGTHGSESLLEVSESVAPPLDVEHVRLVQQAVEDGGGECLVASEQFGPLAHAFVGGDQDRAAALAVSNQSEEQAGLLAAHRLEAELVDDEQAGGEVLATAQACGRQVRIGLEHDLQLVEAVELRGEAVLDGLHAETPTSPCRAPMFSIGGTLPRIPPHPARGRQCDFP
jgi:hypothetical protein